MFRSPPSIRADSPVVLPSRDLSDAPPKATPAVAKTPTPRTVAPPAANFAILLPPLFGTWDTALACWRCNHCLWTSRLSVAACFATAGRTELCAEICTAR